MADERTEKATTKKREDERKKGHVFQSQDLVSALSALCMFAALKVLGASFGQKIAGGMTVLLRGSSAEIKGASDIAGRLQMVLSVCAGVLVPLMLLYVGVNVVATMAQTRLLVTPVQMKPDFSRVNPIKGFGRLFSLNALADSIKSILKIAVIGCVVYAEVQPQLRRVLLLFDTSLGEALTWTASVIIDVGMKVSIAMLLIGAADYFYQWWSFERQMRMTKEEVKEEFKQTEGNPETKNRIRSVQRRMAQMRMMQQVPSADVVIRNPTHYAVALQYKASKAKAPVVLAKGRDNIALKIVEIAIEHNVSVTENRPLAQALYKNVEIGQEIPAEFYRAVAEVLAYIYRLRRAGRI